MKNLFSIVLGLLLFFCPLAVQAEETAEAPAPEPLSKDALNYLLGEDMIKALFLGKATKLLPSLITINQRKNREGSPTSIENH